MASNGLLLAIAMCNGDRGAEVPAVGRVRIVG